MSKKPLIGLYGGTFSPVHAGHIAAVDLFLEQTEVERVYLVPAAIPPHKQMNPPVGAWARFDMLRLAFSSDLRYNSSIFLSTYELTAPAPNYSIHTVRHFMEREQADVMFLCGTDMLLSLDTWYEAAELMRLCRFAVMRRYGSDEADPSIVTEKIRYLSDTYGARITELNGKVLELSSTEVRDRIRCGGDTAGLIPDSVLTYIRQNHLYGS